MGFPYRRKAKVIELGGSRYICLPKDWVNAHDVRKGEILDTLGNLMFFTLPPIKITNEVADQILKEVEMFLEISKGTAEVLRELSLEKIEDCSKGHIGCESFVFDTDRDIFLCRKAKCTGYSPNQTIAKLFTKLASEEQ